MLLRYGTNQNGSVEKKAHIYVRDEHGIDPRLVSPDAAWVIKRLRAEGFHAYVVGGAVRDLLLGRKPNDFDVATDAVPQKLRRIFRSARLIGRRFRIVHVYFTRDSYIEVTTFRSNSPDSNNLFGTMEEDAQRRDFTFNALYYCPVDGQLFDYVNGYPDIKGRKLRTLHPAEASFTEDPVRMIRAVKYASLTGFPVPLGMAVLIKRLRAELLKCSRERMTEEVYKILTSGDSVGILALALRLRLFEVLLPALWGDLKASRVRLGDSPLQVRLSALDAEARAGRVLPRDQMFGFLFRDLVMARNELFKDPEPAFLIQQLIRASAEPLFPSKKDLAVAAHTLLKEHRKLFPRPAHHAPGAPAQAPRPAQPPRAAKAPHGTPAQQGPHTPRRDDPQAGRPGRRRRRRRH